MLSLTLFFTSLVISQEDPGDGYEWVYEDVEEVEYCESYSISISDIN